LATYHGLVWVGGTRRGEEDVDVGGGCSREEGASSTELPLPPGRAPRVRDDIASDYYLHTLRTHAFGTHEACFLEAFSIAESIAESILGEESK
jgi:hypothetical protein